MTSFLVSACGALFLAWLMGMGGIRKLRRLRDYAAQIDAYALLPAGSGVRLALPLALAELAAGSALVPYRTRIAGAFASLLLLSVYTAAIAINLQRGRVDVDCGCGRGPSRLGGWMLVRNAVLISCAVVVIRVPPDAGARVPVWAAVAVSIVAALLYTACDFLMRRDELLRDE